MSLAKPKHRFCVEHALEAGEPVEGWAGHGAAQLFIRWPKAKWSDKIRVGQGMDEAQEALLDRIVEDGRRASLIDRKSDDDPALRVLLRPEMLSFDLEAEELTPYLEAVAEGGDLTRFRPESTNGRLVLVCTHAKHDKCCAKWGFALYKALAAAAEAHEDFDIWEATHLGGCRLASSSLFFPRHGGRPRAYGRAMPADAVAMLKAEAADLPYPPRFKGSAHLTPAEQVAEVIALRAFAELDMPLAPVQVSQIGRDARGRTYRVTTAAAEAKVHCRQKPCHRYGSCGDMEADAPIEPEYDPWFGELVGVTEKMVPAQ
ncbi:MAG: sucrase ferredoxin [Pseudomonadota bacterium]